MARIANRTSFKPGQSGNPGGRPALLKDVQECARQYSTEAINGLVAIARDPTSPPSARASAWAHVLDRAWGKPAQALDVSTTQKPIREMSDAELMAIIQGGNDEEPAETTTNGHDTH